ncbi:hypothetical protein Rhopal_006374-T1 [Rhodotorula paludigena]|uniref:Uncharacterized protein n=1 Tax=Rhodotorula paludigena TaxID=86838 RepID=A0AAV5GVF1_9BASI|nr:hypothetical protein Rhopal_006374-T1 [Rhodotorula paludigena]
MEPLEQVTSNDSAASVELLDYLVCRCSGLEQCKQCACDFRASSPVSAPVWGTRLTNALLVPLAPGEDNSFTAGIDPEPFREAIQVEFTMNKDGEPQCKKHKKTECSQCFSLKKQIVKLTKEGQKRAKIDAKNNPISNLLV